jgi:phage tail tape-measure protein
MATERKVNVDRADVDRDANPDPITGEAGAHPVGTGIGAAAAGAEAMGAAAGLGAGPVGSAIGAAVGAIAGGLAGKGIAEKIDPTTEDAYWRENYPTRSYYDESTSYEEIAPAYRYGWESRSRYGDRTWDEAESDLQSGWNETKHSAKVGWEKAKHASRDAWHRVERALPGDADKDGR